MGEESPALTPTEDFVRYPRPTDSHDYGSVDRLQALVECVGLLHTIGLLVGFALVVCVTQFSAKSGVHILIAVALGMVVYLMTHLVSDRIAVGLGRENWGPQALRFLSIFPSILLAVLPPGWLNLTGFGITSCLLLGYIGLHIWPELIRYGVHPLAIRGYRSGEAVLTRLKRSERLLEPQSADPLYSAEPPKLGG